MKGHDELVQARLADLPIVRVDIEVAGRSKPGLENVSGEIVAVLAVEEKENARRLDLRGCVGLPVLVVAGTYAAGWPVAERVMEIGPQRLSFAAKDFLANYTGEELKAWEL